MKKTKGFTLIELVIIICIIGIIAAIIIPKLVNANKKIKNMKPNPETTESEFRKHVIDELKKQNEKKMENIIAEKKAKKESILKVGADRNGTRKISETYNYLIIIVSNYHFDLTIGEIQDLRNKRWRLISSYCRAGEINYIFESMGRGLKR